MRGLFRTDFRSFRFLNVTQFLGALNDNLFKLLVIYLLIHVKGAQEASTILSLAGAIFVIPFLVFSSSAGILADRISKRTIIVYAKIFEVTVMTLALIAVWMRSEVGLYTALFFMATHSALFGPAKYGIIPELVEPKRVSKANGSMGAFTYLAIILGTFLASLITDLTHKNFVFESFVCIAVAVIGLIASLGIARTAPQNSTKRINPIFIYEIYKTLKSSWEVPHLLPAIFSSAFFLFIGAFLQLNVIPFTIESLGLSEVGGGYLFVVTAVGIALGAFLSGQISKDRVELGLACIAGFAISILFILLYFFAWSLAASIIILILMGIAGGIFVIPCDSFIQVNSPDAKRGQTIAANNFMGFVGVLLAAFTLYLINNKLQFAAASGFAIMGIATFLFTAVMSGRVSTHFFSFLGRRVLKRFRKLQTMPADLPPDAVVILKNGRWMDAIFLFHCLPALRMIIPRPHMAGFPWINGWFDAFRIVPPDHEKAEPFEAIAGEVEDLLLRKQLVAIFLQPKSKYFLEAEESVALLGRPLYIAQLKKESIAKRFFGIRYRQVLLTLSFEKQE